MISSRQSDRGARAADRLNLIDHGQRSIVGLVITGLVPVAAVRAR
jgi:hypothetical protein